MQLKYPKPHEETIGEEEVTPPPPVAALPPPQRQPSLTAQISKLYQKGLYVRSIVCRTFDQGTQKMDPHNWGIIVEVHPYRAFPLEIHWADGTTKYSMGDDVQVIYPGMTAEECRLYLYESKH